MEIGLIAITVAEVLVVLALLLCCLAFRQLLPEGVHIPGGAAVARRGLQALQSRAQKLTKTEKGKQEPDEADCEEQAPKALGKLEFWVLVGACAVLTVVGLWYINLYAQGAVQAAKYTVALLVAVLCGAVDYREHIIPNNIIFPAFAVRLLFVPLEFLAYGRQAVAVLLQDLLGFAVGFCILFLISLITRGGLGFGDVKLVAVLGIFSGPTMAFGVLLYGVMLSFIAAIVLLAIRKKNRKQSIPFGPFLLIGYVISLVMLLNS